MDTLPDTHGDLIMRTTPPRTNRYEADCAHCGMPVRPLNGILRNTACRGDRPVWTVTHAPAQWLGSPVSGSWVGGCPPVHGPEVAPGGNPALDAFLAKCI